MLHDTRRASRTRTRILQLSVSLRPQTARTNTGMNKRSYEFNMYILGGQGQGLVALGKFVKNSF